MSDEELLSRLMPADDNRIFRVAELLRRGISPQVIFDITKIDHWFLRGFLNIVRLEEKLRTEKSIDRDTMLKAKKYGFADAAIGKFIGKDAVEIRKMRLSMGIKPVFNMVDTCAAEFKAISPYYYTTYRTESEHIEKPRKSIVVLGSGPIRIGQGIEFDFCSVNCIRALKKRGYDAVIINNNPETVSTDFDISDRLYFEPLTPEDVYNVLDVEKPEAVVVQFGGQTAIKLAKAVKDYGYKIFGTDLEDIDAAEDREKFDELLEKIGVQRPQGVTVFTVYDALKAADKLGFPVLVRPSYVLGGQGMEICYDVTDLETYMALINLEEQEHPILIDKYIIGRELEVDAICDGKNILIPGILEHVERTGIHSGDSIAVYPPLNVNPQDEENLIRITKDIALSLHTIGLVNIQYILRDGDIFVIEVNPRSSRTVPYISKVTGVPMVELATRCALGESLLSLGYGEGLYRKAGVYAVKVPVFSNEKITGMDFSLSPEMKSTGEVLGVSPDIGEALLKGMYGSNMKISFKGGVFLSISEKFKWEILPVAVAFKKLGFTIYATEGTQAYLERYLVEGVIPVKRDTDAYLGVKELIDERKVQYIINTPTKGRNSKRFGFKLRRLAADNGVPCLTAVDTANALIRALRMTKSDSDLSVYSLDEYGGK
jgi:carbamoyl-phosphate synthase large subunit